MPAETSSSCPKCGAARTEAAACPACGLAVERMATFAAELEAAVPDIARAAWDRAREHWEEPAAHDELIRLVTLHGCYAWAAARYRQAGAGTGDPIAAQQLARVRKAAEAALVTSASPRPPSPVPYRSTLYVLGVIVLLLLLGLAYASYVRGRGGATRATGDPPARSVPPASQVR